MTKSARPWLFPIAISLLTIFGVFVLPFFFPPAFTEVMSVSNAAGFNNKVAAVAAALCAVAVFVGSLRRPFARKESPLDLRPLPWAATVSAAAFVGVCVGLAGWVVHVSHIRYLGDFGYFNHQIQSAVFYHRHLYTEIEFAYGPLLFYSPALLYRMLAGWHISLPACYVAVLEMQQVVGLLLLAYLVNTLPMSRSWKWFAFCSFSIFTLQPILGLNYTFFRFAMPTATLVFAVSRKKATASAVLLGLGEVLNLAISPEIGFAFTAGALAYALLQVRLIGKVWTWALLAVPCGLGLFLSLAGVPYLKMITLFAGGAFNFIVEPVPHILLFLVALVWLVPRMLSDRWKSRRQDAVLLLACSVLSCALVPVALGRADPGHVFFNGVGIFLLAFVAVSQLARWQQVVWGACLGLTMITGLARVYVFRQIDIGQSVRRTGREYRMSLPVRAVVAAVSHISKGAVERFDGPQFASDAALDGDALQAIVGNGPVATPIEVTLRAEQVLKQRNLYLPDFYCFLINVMDKAAEERKIVEFNRAPWAILPTDGQYTQINTQQLANGVLGFALPYKAKREPYVIGKRFTENLAHHWFPVGQVNEYTVYRNRSVEAALQERAR